jgi:integrase
VSIYKRASGRYAVMIDAEDPMPFRIIEPAPSTKNGRRRTHVIASFRTQAEASKDLARQVKLSETRNLSIEKLGRGRRTLGTFATKKEAEKAERDALTAKDRGTDIDPSKLTMNEVFEKFIESREALDKSGTTIYDYQRKWELYCREHIGSTLVRKLGKAHLVELYANLRRTGGRDASPLSGKTVRHVHGLLHAVLQWALRLEILERNVAGMLGEDDLPRIERKEALAHEPSAIAKLLTDAEDTRTWPLIALAVAGGMRRGELAALRWENVDLEERTIHVRGSYAEIPGRVWLKLPKSNEPRRIDLPELAIQALRRQRKLQAADKLRAGGFYRDDGYVFTPEGGGHYTPNGLYKAFARSAKRAGLGLTKLHAARHSYATWLIANGVDVAIVSKLLGHSEITTTLRTYAHTIEGAGRDAVRKIDDQLDRARLAHRSGTLRASE